MRNIWDISYDIAIEIVFFLITFLQIGRNFAKRKPSNSSNTLFDDLELWNFYNQTSPEYIMPYCVIEYYDCRSFWKKVFIEDSYNQDRNYK